jgi:hypothetical protein
MANDNNVRAKFCQPHSDSTPDPSAAARDKGHLVAAPFPNGIDEVSPFSAPNNNELVLHCDLSMDFADFFAVLEVA